MNFNLYQLFDVLACQVGPIFEAINHEVAKRMVYRIAKEHGIALDDHELHYVGVRSDSVGDITIIPAEKIDLVVNK